MAPLFSGRKHAFYGEANDAVRVLFHHVAHHECLEITHVTTVPVVHLLREFTSGDPQLVGVDDNHMVAADDMGGVRWPVLAQQRDGDLSSEPTQADPGSVDDAPVVGQLTGFGEICASAFHGG